MVGTKCPEPRIQALVVPDIVVSGRSESPGDVFSLVKLHKRVRPRMSGRRSRDRPGYRIHNLIYSGQQCMTVGGEQGAPDELEVMFAWDGVIRSVCNSFLGSPV